MTIGRKIALSVAGVVVAIFAIAAIRVIGLALTIILGVIVTIFVIAAIRRPFPGWTRRDQ